MGGIIVAIIRHGSVIYYVARHVLFQCAEGAALPVFMFDGFRNAVKAPALNLNN